MGDGNPALERMMASAMEQIRHADGKSSAAGFDTGKGRVVVDDPIGEEDFLAAAAAHVQRRGVVEGAGGCDSGEKPIVFAIPEGVRRRDDRSFGQSVCRGNGCRG